MTRLLDLTASNFRGYGATPTTVNLDSDIILFYGPNGFGKTSFAEALEWLFYGSTRRRKRGEVLSATEYGGTYANAHGGQPVEVSARVRLADGREVTLTRRMTDPAASENSVTLIDGALGDFTTFGLLVPDAVYPVIVQHGLQTFIHARPKARRDAISAALGLDEMAAFKTAIDGARRSFQGTPPRPVVEARNRLRLLAPLLADVPETAKMAARWAKPTADIDPAKDIPALVKAARRLGGAKSDDPATLIAALTAARREAERAVFDLTKLTPTSDMAACIQRLLRERGSAAEALAALGKAVGARVAVVAAAHAQERLAFWQAGLAQAPEGDECPMCEAATLTAERRLALRMRLEAAAHLLARTQELQVSVGVAKRHLQQVAQVTRMLPRPELSLEDLGFLKALLTDESDVLNGFMGRFDAVETAWRQYDAAYDAMATHVHSLVTRLANGLQAPEVVAEQGALPTAVEAAVVALAEALTGYQTGWDGFTKAVGARVSSNTEVKRLDALISALSADREMRAITAYDAVLDQSKALMQEAEAYLQKKQVELLGARGDEVRGWYDLMNPGADVGYDGMEPGTDHVKLHARSFGVRMGAAANLSECQLNCLGLAVWMMRATTPGSPFGFVVFDDPIQSMDDDHTEAFIGSVVPQLLDGHGKQVIVLSHVERVVTRLRELNKARSLRVYNFDAYSAAGPVITTEVKLKKLISEIKTFADGNEAHRTMAVDRLRVLAEQFIRELHAKVQGVPAPAEYDNAKPSELLKLFRTIPGTLPAEHDGLKDTVGFADPAHHTEVGYAAPTKANILTHLNRIECLMRKHGM